MGKATAKNRMYRLVFLMAVSVNFLGLAGCVEEPSVVVPAVSAVNVIDSTLSGPPLGLPHCQFQGNVVVNTVDRFKPDNLVVTEPEMIELKNKTLQLNANTAVIQKNYLLHRNNRFEHVITADAYFCHPAMN